MKIKDPHRKVKIDYSVLCQLLDLYRCAEGTSMRVEYTSLWDTYTTKVSEELIVKANNILNNS
jgi:hypothetical protein